MRATTPTTTKPQKKASKSAFSLIETVVAIGITTSGLLSVLGLMAVGVNQTKETKEDFLAAQLAETVLADLKAEDHNETSSPLHTTTVEASINVPAWRVLQYRTFDKSLYETTAANETNYLVEIVELRTPDSTGTTQSSVRNLTARIIYPWLAASPAIPANTTLTKPNLPSGGISTTPSIKRYSTAFYLP